MHLKSKNDTEMALLWNFPGNCIFETLNNILLEFRRKNAYDILFECEIDRNLNI